MSTPIITAAPTMANPDAFDSVPELREELHHANRTILKLSDQLHSLTRVTQSMSERLAVLVLAHMRNDQDAVKRELDDIVAHHVQVMPKTAGRVH